MKKVLGWLKVHWLMVASLVVIVGSLPAGFLVSSSMNKGIRTRQGAKATEANNKVKNAKIEYVVPSMAPGVEAVRFREAPNEKLIELVRSARAAREAEARAVVSRVEAMNRRDHRAMVEGLLPEPANRAQEARQKVEFLARMAGDRRIGVRTEYEQLLAGIGAGAPPDPVKVATSLADLQQRETERLKAESTTGQLSPEQNAALAKALMDRRVGEAQRRSKEIAVYADLSSFDRQGFGPRTSSIPPAQMSERASQQPPSTAEVFSWHWDYWVVGDILAAIDRGNTAPDGTRAAVEDSLVKRIERLSVEALPMAPEKSATGEEGEEMPPADAEAPAGPAPDPSVSITGRTSNALYDVRRARLTLVVDAARIAEITSALASTNLMSVLDIDVHEVDVWADLRQGYYYGSSPVARVDVEIETLWLRSWTKPLMPKEVRAALGIPDDPAPEVEGEG